MVSFGHPVHRQDAKEKPLQTQKPNHRVPTDIWK